MTAIKTLAAAVLAACVGATALGNEPSFPGVSKAPVSYAGQEQRTMKALADSYAATVPQVPRLQPVASRPATVLVITDSIFNHSENKT